MIEIVRWPSDDDYEWVKRVALATIGKTPVNKVSYEWVTNLADAEHSPIRLLRFMYHIEAPYWVLNELRTHHVGCETFMQSSRNDRQSSFDRNEAKQGMLREEYFEANAQSLMDIMHKRLCGNASPEMIKLATQMRKVTLEKAPWMNGLLVPMCEYRGLVCHEMKCCGRCKQ